MKSSILYFLFTLACLLIYYIGHGQTISPANLISAANYYQSSDDISLYYSFGEITTEQLAAGDLQLSQGFLQTFLLLVPVEEFAPADLQVRVGPNPCQGEFQIFSKQTVALNGQLFDLNGRRLRQFNLQDERTRINIADLPSGSYLLRLFSAEEQVFETYKLIKQ